MARHAVAISFLGALLSAGPVAAQRAGGFEVSAAAGYHTFGSATELDPAAGFAGRLGFWFFGPFSIEGEFNTAKPRTSTAINDQVTVNTVAGWLVGSLPVGNSGSVFLKGGYGSSDYGNCPDVAIPGAGPCGSVGVIQGGAGARFSVMPNLSIRVDGAINTSTSSRKFSNALVQGGVSLMIGGRPKSPKPVDGDPDGDGVRESRDHCPGTPRGATVDASGCSIAPAAPVEPQQKPAPEPKPVAPPAVVPAPAPAPVDTTPRKAPAPQPARGRVVVLPGAIWNYRGSAINPAGLAGLDSVAMLLRENASLVAEVQGYAHDRLVPADNNLLSLRRAEAIKTYIVSKGVTAERLTAVGLGSQTLIVADTTDAARITNRRVEVHLRPKP